MSRQPCGQLTSSTLELRAQLNLTNDQKRRVTIPASMSWSLTWSCDILQVVEHRTWAKLEKELLSRLKSTNPWDLDEMVTPGTAASSFNIHPTDVWNTEKKAGNSLYLNELLIQKCKFSHQVVASTLCLDKLRRVHATLTNPAWITHLLRTIFANFDVECIERAKTLQ